MSQFDWMIVFALNGAIIAYGLYRGRETATSADWFLANRTLPWWMIGLSLYSTAIDSSDLVADSGGTYAIGMSHMVTNWVGVTGGWMLLAHRIAPPMYRAGMYTNAEYLEARFGLGARIASALVQVLYRSLVLGIISTTLYLVLAIVAGWGASAWWVVVAVAAFAAAYTAFGGLRSVAMTDALQSVVMVASSVALFFTVWSAVGGWEGIETKLDAHQSGLATRLLHVGSDNEARLSVDGESPEAIERRLLLGGSLHADAFEIVTTTPAWLVALAWAIIGFSYSIVNHTQSMRLFGARSEWDMKMAVVVSGFILIALNFTNQMIGIIGRALFPDPSLMPLAESLQVRDSTFPLLVRELSSWGVRGLVVSGVAAASFSTFDSIGSTIPSLLVRDIYARVFVRDRTDRHYLAVSRLLTPVVILGSFAFVPLLLQERGMLLVFLDWVGAFVVPLLAVYLMGSFTRVHRSSALFGLAAGILYGTLRLLAPYCAMQYGVAILPQTLANTYVGTVSSLVLTAAVMLGITAVRGWEASSAPREIEQSGWLAESRIATHLGRFAAFRSASRLPGLLGSATIALGLLLSFVIFW